MVIGFVDGRIDQSALEWPGAYYMVLQVERVSP
jgi:hypothetical protein